jgi:hypothetical protein
MSLSIKILLISSFTIFCRLLLPSSSIMLSKEASNRWKIDNYIGKFHDFHSKDKTNRSGMNEVQLGD